MSEPNQINSPVPQTRIPPVDFLLHWDPTGPWAITAIKPDGPIATVSFYPDEEFDAARWILLNQSAGYNLYFHVNRPRRIITKKASRADIATALALHTDIDPVPNLSRPQILASLRTYSPHPSLIVDSGNGYQAFWRIPPDERLAIAEAASAHIQTQLPGSDRVHSIDHIMRLPGTTNYPSAKKRAKGRTTTQSSIVHANWTFLHDLSTFPANPGTDASSTPQTTPWPDYLPADDLADPALQPDLQDGPSPPNALTEKEAAEEVITSAVARVALSIENRNNKLAQESFLCGTRLAPSGLTEDQVHSLLFEAVPGLDRNHRKDSDTIRRQLREGQRRPETNDPRIREMHKMAHTLLDLTPTPTPELYRTALHRHNSLQPDPLPPGKVDKIASRAVEVHNNG